jgi:hypothetical protein
VLELTMASPLVTVLSEVTMLGLRLVLDEYDMEELLLATLVTFDEIASFEPVVPVEL